MQNVATMPSSLTEHDLLERKDYITASEVAAVMGRSEWQSPFDVWVSKCGEQLGYTVDPVAVNDAMVWGTLAEDVILRFTELKLRAHLQDPDLTITRVGKRRKHPNGCMSATLDARIQGRPDAIEAKTYAAFRPNIDWTLWGEEWSDRIPPEYLIQVAAQLACAPDLERVWVVVSVAQTTPSFYCVERKDHLALIAQIEQEVCAFWNNHVLTLLPPPGGPTLEGIKRVHAPKVVGKIVVLDDAPLERSKALGTQLGLLKKEHDSINAGIRAAMLGADRGETPKGHSITVSTISVGPKEVEGYSYDRLNIKLKAAV